MKMNLYVLKDRLGKEFHVKERGLWTKRFTLPRPIFLCEPLFMADCLYMCEAGDLPDAPRFESGTSVVCVGKPPNDYFPEDIALLVVEEPAPFKSVYNRIDAVYTSCENWDATLLHELNGDCDIEKMLVASREIFENDIAIMSDSYSIIYSTPGSKRVLDQRLFPNHEKRSDPPQEVINYFREDDYYTEIMLRKDVFIYPKGILECNTLCSNIFCEDAFIARVTIAELDRTFLDSDALLLEHLSLIIQKALEKDNRRAAKKPRPLTSLLKSAVLNNQAISDDPFTYAQEYKWAAGDRFACLYLRIKESEKDNLMLERMCLQIEEQFKGACAFITEDSIGALLNIEQLDLAGYDVYAYIQAFLDWNNLAAGLSRYFTDIHKIHHYYRQASRAYKLGKRQQEGNNLFPFDSLFIVYLCDKCLEDFPAEVLCSRELLILQKHDECNKTQLFETLRKLLECNMSPTECARALYVHRATLLHRIARIKELTALDLDDANTRFELSVSYQMLEYHLLDESSPGFVANQ